MSHGSTLFFFLETRMSHGSTLTNVTALPDTESLLYPTDDENTSNVVHPDKGSRRNPRDHRYNEVIKTSSRSPRRGTEWNRDQKHGEERNRRMQSTRQRDSKGFGTEFESNSRGVSSSMESLDSILSPQMDLPPVIELLGQSSSDILRPVNRGPESNSSGSSGTHQRQDDSVNDGTRYRSERSQESTHSSSNETHSNRRGTRQNIRETSCTQRETQLHKQDTHSRQRERNSNKPDTYSHQRATHENMRETHSKQRGAPDSIRDTQSNKHSNEKDTHSQKRDPHKNMRDTHSPRHDTRSNQSAPESTKVFSHPVIKSGNSLKMTPSIRRPVSDVLPSKPLSPASRSPGKFSYTMHSRKTNK